MHITARVFWLPKAGNGRDEYEDAYWPAQGGRRGAARLRFAVADGATETSYAGLWARLLAHRYGGGELNLEASGADLATAQTLWRNDVLSRPLPWYAQEKAQQGAYAALLGLELSAQGGRGGGRWQAQAVGDCCLAQVRDGAAITTFPAEDADFFTSRPFLLSSNPAQNGGLAGNLRRVDGTCQPGDTFFLMTDALAQWLLEADGRGQPPWTILRETAVPGGARRFATWIGELRARRELRNDDVTLVVVEVGNGLAHTARI